MPRRRVKKIKIILMVLALAAFSGQIFYPAAARAAYCQCFNTNQNNYQNFECHTLPQAAESLRKSYVQEQCTEQCIALRPAEGVAKSDVAGKVTFGEDACPPLQNNLEAQTTVMIDDLKIAKPLIEINVPNLNLSEVKNTTYEDSQGRIYLQLPWIGEYLAALYRFAVVIASIFAAVMVIKKSFDILMSGGGEEKTAAYKRIGQIIVGVGLVWVSYVLLYHLNPDLVKFKVLSVQFIQRQDLPPEDLQPSTDSAQDNAPEFSGDNNWVPIGNIPNVASAGGKTARPDVVEALRRAAKNFPGKVNLSSAGRSPAQQYAIMVKKCLCQKAETLPDNVPTGQWAEYCTRIKSGEGCDAGYKKIGRKDRQFTGPNISHTGGNALDLGAEGGYVIACTGQEKEVQKSAGVINSQNYKGLNYCIPEKQQKLIKAMLSEGFCVALKATSGLRESWHFELTGNSAINSSFCTKDLSDPSLQKLEFLK